MIRTRALLVVRRMLRTAFAVIAGSPNVGITTATGRACSRYQRRAGADGSDIRGASPSRAPSGVSRSGKVSSRYATSRPPW